MSVGVHARVCVYDIVFLFFMFQLSLCEALYIYRFERCYKADLLHHLTLRRVCEPRAEPKASLVLSCGPKGMH